MDPYTVEQLEAPRPSAEQIIAKARLGEPGADTRLLLYVEMALDFEWHRGRHVGRNEIHPSYA